MKEFKFLKVLDYLAPIFKKLDVDYENMRRILKIKLLMDTRRVSSINQNNFSKEEDLEKNNFLKTLYFYIFIGLFLSIMSIFGNNYLYQMAIVYGLFMFFMITSLISDFSSVLLDVRDKTLLLSKPIDSKTLNYAKILHIFNYIFMITMALLGPTLLVNLIRNGLVFALIIFIEILLIDMFLIVFTAIIYILILKFFDGERLKDIINYVQIGFTIVMTVGYQILIRSFNIFDLENIVIENNWWTYLISPLWYSASLELIFNKNYEAHIILYSILGIVVPVTSLYLYIKLIPTFERNIQKLNSAGQGSKKTLNINEKIGRLVCRSKEEFTFYKFSVGMIKNERQFKLRVYPSIGFGFLFPLLMIFTFNQDANISQIKDSNMFLSLYFSGFIILAIMEFISYSGNYKGGYIYKTLPMKNKVPIYKGAIKAALVNLFTPVYILLSFIYTFIFGLDTILNIVIIYLNLLLAVCLIFTIQSKELPFSMAFEISNKKNGFLVNIGSIAIISVLYLVHNMILKVELGIYILIISTIALNLIMWNKAFKSTKRDKNRQSS